MSPAAITLAPTGVDLTEGLFSTERTKTKSLSPHVWPRFSRKTTQAFQAVGTTRLSVTEERRARPQARSNSVHESDARSPSPIKGGVARTRHSNSGIRTCDVVDYKIIGEGEDQHAEFRINVCVDRTHWTAHRRFNDFCDLHEMLKLQYPNCSNDVSLPPKRYFKRNKFDPAYLERRRIQLDAYLRAVLSHEEFARSAALRDFTSSSWYPLGGHVTGTEATVRGERGGGVGRHGFGPPVEASSPESVPSMVGMSPRQVQMTVARMQHARVRLMASARQIDPDLAVLASKRMAANPNDRRKFLPRRVQQLRAEPDFGLIARRYKGTPTRGDNGMLVRAASALMALLPAGNHTSPTLDVADTALA